MSDPKLSLTLDFLNPGDFFTGLEDELKEIGREATTEATALILNRIRTRFLAQEAPDGVAWEPSYAAFLRSFTGRGGGTGFDTGNMFHSIQQFSISPLEQSIATDVAYAKYFQEGTEFMPAREFLGFNEEDEDLAIRVLLAKLNEAYP